MYRSRMDVQPCAQLMTLEEAQQLSEQHDARLPLAKRRKPAIWVWQSVEGVLEQRVTDEQIEALLR